MPKSALGKPSKEFGPKHKLFGAALRMTAMELADEKRADKEIRAETNLRRAANALMQKAISGDVPAIKEVADRLDGKVPQGNEHILEKSDALTALIQAIDGNSGTKPSPD